MGRNSEVTLGRRTPNKIIYLACEGGTTGTEGTYIRQLCSAYNCKLIPMYKGSADPLTLAVAAIKFISKDTDLPENSEVWVVFDNDAPKKVKEAFEKIEVHNAAQTNDSLKINIAFNAPSIETWGLLCCNQRVSEDSKVNQAKLNNCMNKYHHTKNPRFDFDAMESGYDSGLQKAKAWKQSAGDSPEYTCGLFAGIYKLVEKIKTEM